MNILIVHAHPEPKSFTSSLKNTAKENLEKQGHYVEISDLYEMNFNPNAFTIMVEWLEKKRCCV